MIPKLMYNTAWLFTTLGTLLFIYNSITWVAAFLEIYFLVCGHFITEKINMQGSFSYRILLLFAALFWCTSCSFAREYSQDEAREARYKMVDYSKQYVGVPYKWGGTGPDGMDCSGFIYTVTRNSIGVQLPRTASEMYNYSRIVPDAEREPGDLVFFKTVGNGKISHAGIYLGNDQFIHSASDGPNTGVIISSLKESYWSRTYAAVGQILPSGGERKENSSALSAGKDENRTAGDTSDTSGSTAIKASGKSFQQEKGGFLSHIIADASLGLDWNFGAAGEFVLNLRGFTFQLHARYSGGKIEPGLGFNVTYDHTMRICQIPVLFSASMPYGFRVYMGPVFTIGKPVQPGTESNVQASIFPGIIGVSWQSPSASLGKVDISFVQDIRYTVFNNRDGSALSVGASLSSGFVFSTGIRIILPVSRFF